MILSRLSQPTRVYIHAMLGQILTVYRNQSEESKSVKIFGLSLTVFELESFSFKNSAHLQCNDLSEKVQVSNL